MNILIWTLIATVALAAVVTVYIFVSAARIFGSESDTPAIMNGKYKSRSHADRREKTDRRIFGGSIVFPIVDRIGHTISAERREFDRRHLNDRRLQSA